MIPQGPMTLGDTVLYFWTLLSVGMFTAMALIFAGVGVVVAYRVLWTGTHELVKVKDSPVEMDRIFKP